MKGAPRRSRAPRGSQTVSPVLCTDEAVLKP
jgi:hypothetical protein